MQKLIRAAAVSVLTIGLGAAAAPAAMADVVVIKNSGPGDVAHSHVEDSDHVGTSQQDKSVSVDDLIAKVRGNLEVEGSEQDQGEKS
ncbi:hypothetical protein [Streptomyces sp. HNM0574]|uniref:hypothetical protein n=1 Tax=Streptomyces sp. HNM0574 TaxID=2714954 RepID=UPI00146BD85C|nr:hypothetical protein [Streptomyces sp. HNM0574]NLU70748.1 hypothetical protein [Streptomyces sp. HNM0574]